VAIVVVDKTSNRAVSLLGMSHCRNFVFRGHENQTETPLTPPNIRAVFPKSAASQCELRNVTGRKAPCHASGRSPFKMPLK
jgi:hypothetical protein